MRKPTRNPVDQTQLLMAQQPYNTGDVGPGLQRMQRPEVSGDPRHLAAVQQWNAQQKLLQNGPYGDGGYAPPQVPVVDARVPRPATAGMQGPQRDGDVEAMMPAVGARFFQQFNPGANPLANRANPDVMGSLGSSLKPGAVSKLTGRPLGLPLPPQRTDGFSIVEQLATKGAPTPGSENWRAIMPPSSLEALARREQILAPGAPGMQVKGRNS